MTATRIGRHAGFDRVVYEFAGPGTPGWITTWTDDPQGSEKGEPISVRGPETLQVVLTGIKYPEAGDPANVYGSRTVAEESVSVQEIVVTGPFEAELSTFIGTGERAPYAVKTLTNPTRLIIDIQTN